MKFTLYLNLAERLNKIGQSEYDSPERAFQRLASDYYKIPIQNEQFEVNQIDARTFQILTEGAEYILIEQITL